MAKKTLNPLTDTPMKITQLTKDFMLVYIKTNGSAKDKEWFKDLVKRNTIDKVNNLNGEKTKGVDIFAMRKEFAERFFPQLIKEKKSCFDLVNEL